VQPGWHGRKLISMFSRRRSSSGTRTITVSYGGPPARSVTYQAADLAELRALLAEMTQSVNGNAGYRLVTTRKGA
jgi:hypothetical protein